MNEKGKTTEDLRQTLFDAIDAVKVGSMEIRVASSIVKLAEKIIQTAQLELEYSQTCSRLDKQDQGISTGPILLTKGATVSLEE